MARIPGGTNDFRPHTTRALLAIFLFLQLGFGLAGPLTGRTTDAEAYRRAGARLLEHGSPYGDRELPYLYPPALAVAFASVAALPPRLVAAGWAAFSAILLTMAVARVAAGSRRILWLAMAFAPFAATQWNAQANAPLLIALAAARPLLARREIASGLAIGASLAVKPLALPAAAGLAVRGRAIAAIVAIAVGAASLLLVLPFGGSPQEAAWRATRAMMIGQHSTWGSNISLAGTLDRLLGPDVKGLRSLGLKTIPFLILGMAVIRKLAPVAAFDAVLAGTLLAARASWNHHATVLFPAVAALSPRQATVVSALLLVTAGWKLLTPAVGACGTIALIILVAAPFTAVETDAAPTSGPS